MKFGGNKKSSDKKKFDGKKADFKTVASLWDGKHGPWVKGDTYGGTLLYLAKDKDGSVKGLYKVSKMNFRTNEVMQETAKNDLPKDLIASMSINLEAEANEKVDLSKIEDLAELFEETDSSSDD
jgi:hypothetical protein